MLSLIASINSFATGLGQPCGIAIDESGNIAVSDVAASNTKIYEFTPSAFRTAFATGLNDPQLGLAFTSVPEPSGITSVLLGGISLLLLRRRARQLSVES